VVKLICVISVILPFGRLGAQAATRRQVAIPATSHECFGVILPSSPFDGANEAVEKPVYAPAFL
jgi:hypothetical protein